MLGNLSGLQFLHASEGGGLDDIDVFSAPGFNHSSQFPLSVWNRSHIMGQMGEIHSSLHFLSPSLNCKFWEGRGLQLFLSALLEP